MVEVGSVTLASNQFLFRPLATNDTVNVVQGSQGLYHIWISVREMHMDPANFKIEFTFRRVDTGQTIADNTVSIARLQQDGAYYEQTGLIGFLCKSARQCPTAVNSVVGQHILIHLDARDEAGLTATDERQVIVAGSPLPTPSP